MSSSRDAVVVGASAGGIDALQDVLSGAPTDLPAAVLVVLHIPPGGGRALARILARASALPAAPAVDGEPLRPGRVDVCVPRPQDRTPLPMSLANARWPPR